MFFTSRKLQLDRCISSSWRGLLMELASPSLHW